MSQQPPYPGWSPQQPEPSWGTPTPPPPPAPPSGPPMGPASSAPNPGWNAGWTPQPLAIKPGVVPLRPLGVGEILDGAFTYIRKQPAAVLGISALVAVVSSLLQLVANIVTFSSFSATDEFDGSESAGEVFGALGGIIGGSAVAGLISFLFQTIGTGLLTVVMARAVLGVNISASEAWQRSKALILPLIGLVILYTLAWIVGGVLCILPGIFIYVMWGVAVPALMLERTSIRGAFGRSWALVKDRWWRTFGLLLLGTVIATVVSQVIVTPFSIVGAVVDGAFSSTASNDVPWATLLLGAIGTIAATTVALPFSAGVIALIYTDLRIRREAFDLELMRAAGVTPPPPQSWPGASPMPGPAAAGPGAYGQPPASAPSAPPVPPVPPSKPWDSFEPPSAPPPG